MYHWEWITHKNYSFRLHSTWYAEIFHQLGLTEDWLMFTERVQAICKKRGQARHFIRSISHWDVTGTGSAGGWMEKFTKPNQHDSFMCWWSEEEHHLLRWRNHWGGIYCLYQQRNPIKNEEHEQFWFKHYISQMRSAKFRWVRQKIFATFPTWY